ncbi:DUF2142 domain-containing protein [Synechococcus sp. UW86]|uniref:DUF2142 domain-containing protein n=1 Tax=Synechococcus sp. UW86 TaxID=368491 RepID=UPI0014831E96|nr:DUF2142 domain-containing protein [Synechococcus sp. UW86]
MKRTFAAIFCGLLVVSGLLIGGTTPPLLSPDEHAHLVRAYTLISGEWRMHTPAGRSTAAWVDPALAKYINVHRESNRVAVGRSPGPPPTTAELVAAGNTSLSESAKPISISAPGAAVYPPIAYLPQGLALFSARALHLPMATAYALARLVSLTTSAAVLFAAFLLVTPNPLQLALLTLPMSLFQLASAALDGFSTGLAMLAISLYQSLPEAQPRHRPIIHVCLVSSILIVVPARLHLWPLLILLFLSARKIKSVWAWFTSLACLSTVLNWVASVSRNTVDLRRAELSTDTVQTAIHSLSHPGELIALVLRTLTNHELQNFYFRSFIGVLGWLHLPLEPSKAYQMLGLMLAIFTVLTLNWISQRTWRMLLEQTRWLLVGMAMLSAMSVFLLLLVAWTPDPANALLIEGVQGRYFLVPALMVAMAVAPPQKQQQRLPSLVLSYVSGSVMLMVSTALTLRVL